VKTVAETLLDLAKVQEGEPLKDAAGFARRISTLLAGSLTS
jgi:HSP90 family molecular chaperone